MRPRSRYLPVAAPVGTTAVVVALLALKPTSDPALEHGATALGGATRPIATAPEPSRPAGWATSRPAATPTTSRTAPRPATTSATPKRATSSAAPTKTSSPTPTKTVSTVTVTGATVSTKYGPVQVRITVRSGRITSAQAIQYPDETARSRELSSRAIPVLEDETVTAQSANIDSVSGATYTSGGYTQSLQSALDRAGL